MPYLRLHSPDVPIEQKRVIAQKLVDITLRTFHLRPEERNRITIQFIPTRQVNGVDGPQLAIPHGGDFMLEVMAHHLTEAKKRAFAEEAAATLAPLLPTKARSRIASLLGIKAYRQRQITLQFDELSTAISDPFVVDPELRAAWSAPLPTRSREPAGAAGQAEGSCEGAERDPRGHKIRRWAVS